MRILCVDNYDSFTWNLVALLERLGASVDVVPHDAAPAAELCARAVDGWVLSPGPCTPAESHASLELARMAVAGALGAPLLGVCLGHQAIGVAVGARVVRGARPVHGEAHPIHHAGDGMYAGLPQRFLAARYNSLVLERASLPPELAVTAWTDEGEVMGVRHARHPVEGVQFHPESFLTEVGARLVQGWLSRIHVQAGAA